LEIVLQILAIVLVVGHKADFTNMLISFQNHFVEELIVNLENSRVLVAELQETWHIRASMLSLVE